MLDRRMLELAPAVLCVGFGGWLGTFPGAADALPAMLAHLICFGILATAGRVVLGGQGGVVWVWWVAAGLVGLAVATSPVPRAGLTALALGPCFLILPRWTARCFAARRCAGRRCAGRSGRGSSAAPWTTPALSVAVLGIAAAGLWRWRVDGSEVAAMPLGHHNLLAIFLLTLLPLALLPWRDGGARRWLACAAGVSALAALVATESLAGIVGLGVMTLAWAWGGRGESGHAARGRRMLAVTVVAAAALARYGPRLLRIVAGTDRSASARLGYLEAGWRGVLERPLLGWGPGSTPWTVHEHFRPVPGIHPPDQVLADLHCLPLQVLYEVGVVGVLGLVAALFVSWRTIRRRQLVDPGLARAGALGLSGAAVASLGGLSLMVTALPVALAVAAGAWIGAHRAPTAGGQRRLHACALPALALLLFFWQLPRDLAHLHWHRAATASDVSTEELAGASAGSAALDELRRAVELDPSFPLYRWRWALGTGDAAEARRAAEDARGVSALWTSAGSLALPGPRASAALDRACALSHFAAAPPLLRLESGVSGGGAFDPAVAARAVAASPLLLASPLFESPLPVSPLAEDRLGLTLRRLGRHSGLPWAWLQAVQDAADEVAAIPPREGETRLLVLDVDGEEATSLSLHTFRRRSWPARIAVIELYGGRLPPLLDLPAATTFFDAPAGLFATPTCALAEVSGTASF